MRYSFKAEFFKALAHPLRIQVLDELRAGPLSVGQLRERTGAEQSTLSQQLGVLRAHNLVCTRRKGTMVNYEIRDPAIWMLLDRARDIFDHQLVDVRAELESVSTEASNRH
jgi:DNA-binding transcriptional ArsR family regulator